MSASPLQLNLDPSFHQPSNDTAGLEGGLRRQPQLTSSERLYSNADLIAEICEFLNYDDDLELDPQDVAESRLNLARLALAGKAFLEPAIDRLWHSLDTLYPLFRILPAFVKADGTYVLRGSIAEQDWERFDWYARRIKRFCYTRDPDKYDIAMHVYFRVAQLRTNTLLPNLRHLYCPDISQPDFLISAICLFLSPSLQHLEFCKISKIEDKLTGTFLHTVLHDGAQLESIVVKGCGLSKDTLNLILKFHNLKNLEVTGMGRGLQLEWLKAVAQMPKLEELALDFVDSPIEPLIEDIGFQNLKDLMITAPLSFTRIFLPHISAPNLECIVAATPLDTSADRSEFVRYVVDRWRRTLRRFGLVHTGAEVSDLFDMTAIAPLFTLRQLDSFRLEGYEMDLRDGDIAIFATAWPQMTKLLLPFLGPLRERPTIASLWTLAELNPQLTHIRIPLSTSDIPPFISPLSGGVPFLISFPPAPSSELFSSSSTAPDPTELSTTPPAATTPPTATTGAPATATSTGVTVSTLPVVPSFSISISNAQRRSHGLERLTLATEDDDWSMREQLHLARYIDFLFPRIRYVTYLEGHDDDRWENVNDVVQALQAVRAETASIYRR